MTQTLCCKIKHKICNAHHFIFSAVSNGFQNSMVVGGKIDKNPYNDDAMNDLNILIAKMWNTCMLKYLEADMHENRKKSQI